MQKIPDHVITELKRYPVAYRIKRLRNMMGWTQEELAEKLGYRQGAVSNWEGGINTPNSSSRERLIQVFDLPLDFFIDQDIQAFKKKG